MSEYNNFSVLTKIVKSHEFPESIKDYKIYDIALGFLYLAYHPIIKNVSKQVSKKLLTKTQKDILKYKFREDQVKREYTGISDMNNTIFKIIKYVGNGKIEKEEKDLTIHQKFLQKSIDDLEDKVKKADGKIKEQLIKLLDTKKKLLIKMNVKDDTNDNDILINPLHINGIGNKVFTIYRGTKKDNVERNYESKENKIKTLNENFKIINQLCKNDGKIDGFAGPDKTGDDYVFTSNVRSKTFDYDSKFRGKKEQKHKDIKINTSNIYKPPVAPKKEIDYEKSNLYKPPPLIKKDNKKFDNNYTPPNKNPKPYRNKHNKEKGLDGFVSIGKLKKKEFKIRKEDFPELSLGKKTEETKDNEDEKEKKVEVIKMDNTNQFDILDLWDGDGNEVNEEVDKKWCNIENEEEDEEYIEDFTTYQYENKFNTRYGSVIIYDFTFNKHTNEKFKDICNRTKIILRDEINRNETKKNDYVFDIQTKQISKNKFYRKYILPKKKDINVKLPMYEYQNEFKEGDDLYDDDSSSGLEMLKYYKSLGLSNKDIQDMNVKITHDLESDDSEELFYDEDGNFILEEEEIIEEDETSDEYSYYEITDYSEEDYEE